MPLQLSRSMIKKITHNSFEIRQRALEQIESKILRALAHSEDVEFNAGELFKQLIRWFGYKPLKNKIKVLELMLALMRSKYRDIIIKTVGIRRFERELDKLKQLLIGELGELLLIDNILKQCNEYKLQNQISVDEINDKTAAMNINLVTHDANASSARNGSVQVAEEDYEQCWSKPSVADYNAMKSLADELVNPSATKDDIHEALQHLQFTMQDYPAEYFLQAPNIFLSLVKLYDRHEEVNCSLEEILNTFVEYLYLMNERLRMRKKTLTYAPRSRTNNSDITLLHKTQLKLDKVLHQLLSICMKYFEENVSDVLQNEIFEIIKIFELCLDMCIIEKLTIKTQIVDRMIRACTVAKELCMRLEHVSLHRIYQLILLFLLQRLMHINATETSTVENSIYLHSVLQDYSIKVCYPEFYEDVENFLRSMDTTNVFEKNWKLFELYEQEIVEMVSLLKSPTRFTARDIIERSCDLSPRAIETFSSCELVVTLYNATVTCIPQYIGNACLREKANTLLLKLLSLSNENLLTPVFKCLVNNFKHHIAVLMNGSIFGAAGWCNQQKLLDRQIIGVPLSTSLLIKLTYSHFESKNDVIKESCDYILSTLLRAYHLLSTYWPRLLELLLPILPLLQCCTQAPNITEAMLKLINPNEAKLPAFDLFRSNIRWLFHPDKQTRIECLNRLNVMLQSKNNSAQYMPKIEEICDLIPNDICLLPVPRSFASIFNNVAGDSHEEHLTTFRTLLALLDSTDIEPMIRKTTLMQLNILCGDWAMSMAVCRERTYCHALQILDSALMKSSYMNYQDTALPAVGILSKILFCDATIRDELAKNEMVYILLLRTLFLYGDDVHARSDVVISLFLLLFTTFLSVTPPGIKEGGIEGPEIMSNLQMPVKLSLRSDQEKSEKIPNDVTKQMAIFKSEAEERVFVAQVVAASFCDGLLNINSSWMKAQTQYDFNFELYMTKREWHLVKATQPNKNLLRFIKDAENATVNTTVINATQSMKLQMVLNNMGCTKEWQGEQRSSSIASALLKLFNKYLRLQPGDDRDFVLFEHLLELNDLCIQMQCTVIIEGLFKALQDDFQHAFIILLQTAETPLRFYRKLTQILKHLLQSVNDNSCNSKNSASKLIQIDPDAIFFSNLFELFFNVSKLLFDQRDLLRMRSLISVLQLLSNKPLEMADDQLQQYCNGFLNFSISLNSLAQTGSQLQRDCLQIVCQLCAQMTKVDETLILEDSFIKYLSTMGAHNDYRVRSLAWCVLAKVAQCDDGSAMGAELLKKSLAYLPGGFMACCLSTLLDYNEVCLVRHLAGNVLTEFLPKCMNFEEAIALLDQHAFYRFCHDALSVCVLNTVLPRDFDLHGEQANINSCEVFSCICRICITLLTMQPSYVKDLCTKSFMFKLYELLKVPVEEESQAYLIMCTDICHVYAMCYEDNFVFLQRTLCRDQVWLRCFCLLLDKFYADPEDHVHVLQLLMAVCQDKTGFQYVCENLARTPEVVVEFFTQAFCVVELNSSLQRCGLAMLSFLLIKSQLEKYDFITFAEMLEKPIEWQMEQEKSACSLSTYQQSGTERIFIELYRIFIHIYPLKACKFDSNPSPIKKQVCETISVLLRVSPNAQSTANNLKFLDKLLQIFNTHIEDFNTSCSTFVRRYGEFKKLSIINNYQLLFAIILNWYTNGTAVLTNEHQALTITKLLLQIWPWLAHSAELKTLILNVCFVLSRYSLVVCKKFSSPISTYAHSVLQLISKMVIAETQRIKPVGTESFPVISFGLRTAMNCCLCPEGRTTLLKAGLLNSLDNMHPFNPKAPKLKPDIVHSWLLFWEVFSSHIDGAKLRNLSTLCEVANKSPENSATRLIILRILRNMCFVTVNRVPLMASTDFIQTVDEVLSKTLNADATESNVGYEEPFIVCVGVCKIISGGVKYVSMVRSSKLGKKIKMLFESVKNIKSTTEETKFKLIPFATDLYEVLEHIISLFNK